MSQTCFRILKSNLTCFRTLQKFQIFSKIFRFSLAFFLFLVFFSSIFILYLFVIMYLLCIFIQVLQRLPLRVLPTTIAHVTNPTYMVCQRRAGTWQNHVQRGGLVKYIVNLYLLFSFSPILIITIIIFIVFIILIHSFSTLLHVNHRNFHYLLSFIIINYYFHFHQYSS